MESARARERESKRKEAERERGADTEDARTVVGRSVSQTLTLLHNADVVVVVVVADSKINNTDGPDHPPRIESDVELNK